MMTGREKIESALSPQGTPEIGVGLCYTVLLVRDLWKQVTSCPWWYRFSPEFEQQIAWRRDSINTIGQDWFDLRDGHMMPGRAQFQLEVVNGNVYRVDKTTGTRTPVPKPAIGGWHQGYAKSNHPERLVDTHAAIDRLLCVSKPVAAANPSDELTDVSQALCREFCTTHLPIGYTQSPLSRCYDVWGFEGMMLMIADRPDLVQHACECYLRILLPALDSQAHMGVKAVWLEEILTDMINPAAYAELCFPYARRIVAHIRSLGMSSIYYYCGDPRGKLEYIIRAQPDCIGLEESKKTFTIDIEDVVDFVDGRCAVLGNVDAINLLPKASEQELAAEIARQVRAGRRNKSRFIIGIGSPVTPETPLARVRLFCDLSRRSGTG